MGYCVYEVVFVIEVFILRYGDGRGKMVILRIG